MIATLTALPQSAGWVADPYMPLAEAASRYAEFVRESIAALGQAHITGRPDAAGGPPPVSARPSIPSSASAEPAARSGPQRRGGNLPDTKGICSRCMSWPMSRPR